MTLLLVRTSTKIGEAAEAVTPKDKNKRK